MMEIEKIVSTIALTEDKEMFTIVPSPASAPASASAPPLKEKEIVETFTTNH
jgi:hypothetical protein